MPAPAILRSISSAYVNPEAIYPVEPQPILSIAPILNQEAIGHLNERHVDCSSPGRAGHVRTEDQDLVCEVELLAKNFLSNTVVEQKVG